VQEPTVLLVEPDAATRDTLSAALALDGYVVWTAASAAEALARTTAAPPALVVVAEPLPDSPALALCRRLRRLVAGPLAIVILLHTADTPQRLAALAAGADDVLAKPCHPDELRARLRARLRRRDTAAQVALPPGVQLDAQRRTALVQGRALTLTRREFALFAALAQAAGRLVPRAALVRAVWGDARAPNTNLLEVYIGRLRRKLAAAGYPAAIRTRWRAGYQLDLLPPAAPPTPPTDRAP